MVTGGEKEDNGDVYGGSMGLVGDRYKMAFCANVKETDVNINIEGSTALPTDYKTSPSASNACITGSVYGGGENGHVLGQCCSENDGQGSGAALSVGREAGGRSGDDQAGTESRRRQS